MQQNLKMTPSEYLQLKAFARIDGGLLALLWSASFACYIKGLQYPVLGITALLLMLLTPFYVAYRLKRFRDVDLNGVISLMRGWAFVALVFFYGAVLLALVQYVYFAYIDHGYLLSYFHQAMESQEMKDMLNTYGMSEMMNESVQMLSEMRPIDYALNVLTLNITFGLIIGWPIAALLKR